MAPTQITKDYYAILEISQTADLASIRSSYKRLAKAKHPDKNSTNPNATAEFQVLQEAYSTICDPETRRSYDIQYIFIKRAQQTKPQKSNAETPQQKSSSENKNTEEKGSEKKHRAALREKKLQELDSRKTRQNYEVFEEKRVLNKLQKELSKLQEDLDNEAREQAAKVSWWGYLDSYITRKARETEEEKAERERRQLDRRAAQNIKEKLFERQRTKVRSLETGLEGIENEINRIRLEIRTEEDEGEEIRQREAQKKQAEAEERRKAEQVKIRREFEVRMAEERRHAAAAEEQRRRQQAEAEAKRQRQQAQAEEQRRRQQADAEEEKKRKRKAEEKLRKIRTRTQSATSRSTSTMASCSHKAWWRQVEGGRECSRCSTVTRRFAFQCPTCDMVACASCRDIMKRTGSSQFGSRNFRKTDDSHQSRWPGVAVEDYDDIWY